jgi:hypothetical protein
MVGDFRTDALHQALREKPIDDDQLIAMLVLALGGRNVTVMSGVAGRYRASSLGAVAATLTEGRAVTRDLVIIRQAAREALVEVLSCRENQSASGIGARYAGAAIDADAFLATEEFLPALSRAALEQCASANSVAPQARVKDTRAALIARIGDGTFVYPGARFEPTEEEQAAQRERARSNAFDEEDKEELGDGGDGSDLDLAEDGAEATDLNTPPAHGGIPEDRAAA